MSAPGLKRGWVEIDVRELRGSLTTKQAAVLAGVSRRAWQRWEVAGRMPADVLEFFQLMRKSKRERS